MSSPGGWEYRLHVFEEWVRGDATMPDGKLMELARGVGHGEPRTKQSGGEKRQRRLSALVKVFQRQCITSGILLLEQRVMPVPSCRHQSRCERGSAMDLTPGEKAVLGQIRVLYASEARREHQIKALMMQWPPVHQEAYKRAYGGLLAKAPDPGRWRADVPDYRNRFARHRGNSAKTASTAARALCVDAREIQSGWCFPQLLRETKSQARYPACWARYAVVPLGTHMHPTRPLRVIVADDDRDTVMMLGILLRSEGMLVRLETRGAKCRRPWVSFPDAVLLDIGMPDRSGLKVALDLSRQYGPKCPVLIAVTAHISDAAKRLTAKSGFRHHVDKPYDPDALLQLVGSIERSD